MTEGNSKKPVKPTHARANVLGRHIPASEELGSVASTSR